MSRRYHEQVEVRMGLASQSGVRVTGALPAATVGDPEVPTLFLWRGQLHVVRVVLSQWTQRVPWWRSTEMADAAGGLTGPEGGETGRGDAGAPARVWSRLERVVWRVEARAGTSGGTGVYDLAQDERWWLEHVAD